MFDVAALRSRFPALALEVDGRPAAFLDGPGGTQSPTAVLDAMRDYLATGSSNLGGAFATSRRTGDVVDGARTAMAAFFNARPEEIVFGQNMTSLTFAMSRALARTWRAGDEIVVTRLDHDANVAPWLTAAADAGAGVRWADFNPVDGTFDYASLERAVGPRTRLVAVTHASNAIGTVVDVRRVADIAHAAGALVYVDAVHYAAHGLVDVVAADCDFLVASAYKFFGPHTGVLFGRYDLLDSLEAYRVRPAPAAPPGKWETGTQSFESLAGVAAAVDYVASIGEGTDLRSRIVSAAGVVAAHEADLARRFLSGAAEMPGVRIFGITDDQARTPTFAVDVVGMPPAAVQAQLGADGIFVWSGHYYAVEVMDRLGVLDDGGLVRIGFVHYNTAAEVDRVLAALQNVAESHP